MLRILADDARPALATQCTTLTRRVLDRVVDLLDRDDRVVLIRKLEIRWRLPTEALETKAVAARLAADLIAALEPAWTMPIESPDPDASVVVFPNTATWWSDALEAQAAGRLAWYHHPVLDPEPLLALAEPTHRVLALSVLRHLGRRAPEVLRGSSPDALRAWARALHVVVPHVLDEITPQRDYAARNVDPKLVALVQQVHAASGPNPTPDLVGLGALALRLAQAPPSAPLEAEALAFAEALASVASVASEGPAEVPAPVMESDRVITGEPLFEATSHAGLFYLATLLLELGTGEHLWAACLPEGRLLGWAASGLVGDDPVVHWFGGPDVAMPSVTDAQADEVMAKGCIELARALPRRRPNVAVPPVELSLCGEELIATLPSSVFPLWSAVCSGPPELREAAAVLSECWPGGIAIPPAMDALGLRGKVQVQSERPLRALFRHDALDPATRLAAVAIGTAAALFEWRIGRRCQVSAAAFVERYMKVRGRLEDTGDALIVHLRATDVSFPVRCAGLDRDPGYLPWLERAVMLRFDGDEPEGDELPIVPDEDSG